MRFYLWKRQRIYSILIVVDWYMRLMGNKTTPDSADPRLESFYPTRVADIDLPHQCVVDTYYPRFVHIHKYLQRIWRGACDISLTIIIQTCIEFRAARGGQLIWNLIDWISEASLRLTEWYVIAILLSKRRSQYWFLFNQCLNMKKQYRTKHDLENAWMNYCGHQLYDDVIRWKKFPRY